MNRPKLFAIVGMLVCIASIVAWLGMRSNSADEAPAEPTRRATILEVAPDSLARPEELSTPSEFERHELAVSESVIASDATSTARPELAEVRGRFLLPSGEPARDVELRFSGWNSDEQLAIQSGTPTAWTDLTANTGEDGRFALRFDPPRAYQFTLDVALAGFANCGWRWMELAPASTTDIGDVTLERGCTVRGVIVDKEDRPTGVRWRIYADPVRAPGADSRDDASVSANADLATGAFVLEGLPPGRVTLKAHSRIANWITGPTIELMPDVVAEATLIYDGPDNSRRITVMPVVYPIITYAISNDLKFVAFDARGTELVAQKTQNSSQNWSIEGLERGFYRIELHDDRFEPWSVDNVEPGTALTARLRGNARIALTVSNDEGERVSSYHLRIRVGDSLASSNGSVLRSQDQPEPTDGVYESIVPDEITLIVDADGYCTTEVALGRVAPRETRAVAAVLSRGASVRVAVLDETSGLAVEGAEVQLVRAIERPADADEAWDRASFSARVDAHRSAHSQVCDALGRAEFARVAVGRYQVMARVGAHRRARSEVIEVGSNGSIELEVRLPAAGSVRGRVLAPEGAVFAGLAVSVDRNEGSIDPLEHLLGVMDAAKFKPSATSGALSTDGSFLLEQIPAGEVKLSLQLPSVTMSFGAGRSSTHSGHRQPLGDVVVRASEVTDVEFDLRDVFPGALEIRARINGEPAAGLVVVLEEIDAPGQSGGLLDAMGVASLSALPAGTWRVSLRPADSFWIWRAPQLVAVAPGQRVVREYDVVLVEGRLRVLATEDDQPLAGRFLYLDGTTSVPQFRTDAEGSIVMRLPIGTVALRDADANNSETSAARLAVIEWTANGPVPDVVRFPRAHD